MTTHTVNAHGVDLSPFCGKHDPREWVREPFAQAGWLCATNGTIIVGVKCELPDTPSMPSGLKVAAMLEVAEEAAGPWHPIAAVKIVDGEVCDDCDGTGLGAGRNACRECDGEGIVECNMGHEHDCPDCDGEGEVAGEPDPDAGPCESCDGVGREPAACDLPWRTLYSLSLIHI